MIVRMLVIFFFALALVPKDAPAQTVGYGEGARADYSQPPAERDRALRELDRWYRAPVDPKKLVEVILTPANDPLRVSFDMRQETVVETPLEMLEMSIEWPKAPGTGSNP